MREIGKTVRKRASELLENGTVTRVFGWRKGEFDYDETPAVFCSVSEMKDFVFDGFSAANLSKFLLRGINEDGKILAVMKPCDTFSFNQLLTEHKFDREKVFVLGVPCRGKLDGTELRGRFEGLISVREEGEFVVAETLYDGEIKLPRAEVLPERCRNCKSRGHVAFDELIRENGEMEICGGSGPESNESEPEKTEDKNDEGRGRFDEVKRLEKMTADGRYAFWQNELSRCIRCNACRDVCPACTCEKCVFDNPASGVENKAASTPFEEKLFHIIRAFHVAGRCTDCGECSRVCPQRIPLHLLNRKFIKDIDGFYGEYRAGETVGSRAPLTDFDYGDIEPNDFSGKGGGDA